MTHAKNSTTHAVTQLLPTMKSVRFGNIDEGHHPLQTISGADPYSALVLAADLALGIEKLCSRLDVATNNGDEQAGCVELRSLSLLAGTVAALVKSVNYSLRDALEAAQ